MLAQHSPPPGRRVARRVSLALEMRQPRLLDRVVLVRLLSKETAGDAPQGLGLLGKVHVLVGCHLVQGLNGRPDPLAMSSGSVSGLQFYRISVRCSRSRSSRSLPRQHDAKVPGRPLDIGVGRIPVARSPTVEPARRGVWDLIERRVTPARRHQVPTAEAREDDGDARAERRSRAQGRVGGCRRTSTRRPARSRRGTGPRGAPTTKCKNSSRLEERFVSSVPTHTCQRKLRLR